MFFKHLVFVISVLSFVHSAPSCGENEVYVNCMSPCKPQQCTHLKQMPDCDPNIKCQPGCECIQNFLRNSDNVCISSDICEEYDSEFDPETDIDVILNENDDDEATNEDQVFDNTVSSQDGLIKEADPGSKMISNTEEVENTDQITEDGYQDINGIEDSLSFEEEIKNGDWVMEQTEHNDTNQEPNTDQQKLDNKESEMDTERSTEKQTVQAPENEVKPTTGTTITPNIRQSKISAAELHKFTYEVITTEKSSVDLDLLFVTENKLKPEKIAGQDITEPNQINIDDKISNKKNETLETSTMPDKNELPIKRPGTEVYPEDSEDTNQWPELPRPWHDEQAYTTSRPEQNTDESRESTNKPENNEWPNREPVTEVYPEDTEDTNQRPDPPRPGHDDQLNKTRPEQNTDASRESTNIPENNEWPNRRSGTEVNPEDREDTNQWPEPPKPWHGEQPYTTSRPEQSTKPWYPYIPKRKWHGSKHHKRPISGNNHVTVIYPTYIIIEGKSNERHTYPDIRPKNRYDSECRHDHEHNRQPERRRENEHNREPERRRENEHEHNREPERRREHEYGHDRPSHRRPRTWCRRYPGDRRRPCPWYNKPKHYSHRDYKNKEHNSNHDRSYGRPKRVCRYQRHGKRICYVRKSHKRDSRRN